MSPPSVARLLAVLIPHAIRFHKACGQRRRKFVSQLLLVRKLEKVMPDSAIPIP
jgi:hypothetical protein